MRYPGGHEALTDVTCSIATKEMVFVCGHSGAGKSTLLKLIGAIETASAGEVHVNGQNLTRISRRQIPYHRRNVGMIFQDTRLLPEHTVFENVALPLLICGHSKREVTRRVHAALDKVSLLHMERELPVHLSGGEQQRVDIARAIVNRPPLIVADEPTGNLDPALSREIMGLFIDFNQVGVTVVIATHDLALIRPMRKRTITLQQGRIVDDQAGLATTMDESA